MAGLLSRNNNSTRYAANLQTAQTPDPVITLCDLQPYIEWYDYVEDLSLNVVEENRRDQLIQDFTLILRYLSSGNHLNFATMTSLCDVAGSFKPVRSLILKHMPKLLND